MNENLFLPFISLLFSFLGMLFQFLDWAQITPITIKAHPLYQKVRYFTPWIIIVGLAFGSGRIYQSWESQRGFKATPPIAELRQEPTDQNPPTQTYTPTLPPPPTFTFMPIGTLAHKGTAVTTIKPTLENTQTPTIQVGTFCKPEEIPSAGGIHPDTNGVPICIPRGQYAWISSDEATIEIPSISYNNPIRTGGFTFVFFGPVRFTITGVPPEHVRLDKRYETDLSLITDYDNPAKSQNFIYINGKVCLNRNASSIDTCK